MVINLTIQAYDHGSWLTFAANNRSLDIHVNKQIIKLEDLSPSQRQAIKQSALATLRLNLLEKHYIKYGNNSN